MNNKNIGNLGETKASQYLESKGYQILSRNYRVRFGEIDIIALYKDTLVFVEVKSRKNDKFAPASQAVNYKKQQTIRKVAAAYLNTHSLSFNEIRFDVIEYYYINQPISHLINAF